MGYLIALALVAYLGAIMAAMFFVVEERISPPVGLGFIAAMLVFGIGLVITGEAEQNQRGPCVQYETQMHYNAATKTMMPAKVCIMRGEWLK